MSSKGPWEGRVGILLHNTRWFAWAFKPADSPLYGGQARIDWLACDKLGRHWMVEVKQVAPDRRSINVLSEVSPGQRAALSAVAGTDVGIALLVVGQGETLYVFDWRMVQWRLDQDDGSQGKLAARLPLSSAPIQIKWTGKKAWQNLNWYAEVVKLRQIEHILNIAPIMLTPTRSPSEPVSSPSTSKRRGSIPMRVLMQR